MSAAFMLGPWIVTAPSIISRRPGSSTVTVRLFDSRSPMDSSSESAEQSSSRSSSSTPPKPTSNSSTYIYLSFRRYFDRPGYSLAVVEACRWFDPWAAFPCRVKQLERLEDASPDSFNVHIHNRW